MANQQLIDYVKGQMAAGVSETDIRKVLKDAGWPDAEIEEGVGGAKTASSSPAAAVSAVGQAAASMTKPAEAAKAEPKKEVMNFDFMSNPTGMPAANAAPADVKKNTEKKPVEAAPATGAFPGGGGKSSRLPWIIAAVAVLALAGSVVYSITKISSLSAASDSLTAANSALSAEIAGLKSSGAASATELDAAKAAAKALADELALFVMPQNGTGTPAAAQFTLKGLIGQTKGVYTLTTANGLLLYVKNSKDVKLDFTLKPLVGATAELAGTHVPGSYEITVVTINGGELQSPTPIKFSTSTATSSKTGD